MKSRVFAAAMALMMAGVAGRFDGRGLPAIPNYRTTEEHTSKYDGQPVNKSQECERRRRQMARAAAKAEATT